MGYTVLRLEPRKAIPPVNVNFALLIKLWQMLNFASSA